MTAPGTNSPEFPDGVPNFPNTIPVPHALLNGGDTNLVDARLRIDGGGHKKFHVGPTRLCLSQTP